MAAFQLEDGVTKITGTDVDGKIVILFQHHSTEALRRINNRIPPCTTNTFRLKDVFGAADGANVMVNIGVHCRGYTSTQTERLKDTVEDLRETFTEAGFIQFLPKPRTTCGGFIRKSAHCLKQTLGISA